MAETKSKPVGTIVLGVIVLAYLLLHLLAAGGYGLFRDEFYYIDCARHLDWGYVDHPPLSIAALAGSIALFGDSVTAVRLLPVLIGIAVLVQVWFLVSELGGGVFARAIAVFALLVSGHFHGATGYFSMNAFDFLFWALAFYILVRILKTGNERLWLVLGLVAGLGLLNKISMLFFLFGMGAGLLFSSQRKHLKSKWFWLGMGIAILLFLPYVLWQIPHSWPTLQFMVNAKRFKMTAFSPIQFMLSSVLENMPLNVLVWLPGLVFLFIGRKTKPYRVLGWIFVMALALLVVQKGKPYYLSPAYSALFAAGGVVLESVLSKRRIWARIVLMVLLITGGLCIMPYALPVLPIEKFIAYQKWLGLNPPQAERHEFGELPQFWADCFGWENMATTVSSVYKTLSPEQKKGCAVYGRNYGEAGAINYYRKKYELPMAVSEHNNYYLWGPGDFSGKVLIVIGVSPERLQAEFERVEQRAMVVSRYAMPYETNMPVCVCFGLKGGVGKNWGPPNYI